MYYEAIDRWSIPDSYLEHFGVKGMRWGIRKEPELSGRSRSRRNNLNSKSRIKNVLKYGAIAAGAVLAGAGAYYLYKTVAFNSIVNIGKKSLGVFVEAADKVPDTASDIADAIKPQEQLCNFNSFAASLSGSGKFDISLKSNISDKYVNNVNDLMNKALKNPDSRIYDTIPDNVFRNEEKLSNTILRIAKNQEGACGQISSNLKCPPGIPGKGHAFNWKIEGGQVKYFDTCAGISSGGKRIYKPREDASHYMYGVISGEHGKITRLDNLTKDDLNMDYLNTIFNIKSR